MKMKIHTITTDAIAVAAAEGKIEGAIAILEDIPVDSEHFAGMCNAIGHLQSALSVLFGRMDDEETAAQAS